MCRGLVILRSFFRAGYQVSLPSLSSNFFSCVPSLPRTDGRPLTLWSLETTLEQFCRQFKLHSGCFGALMLARSPN
jgi:hypothetical protein